MRDYPPHRRAAANYEDRPFYWMPGTAIPHVVLVTIYQGLLRAGGRPGPAVVQRSIFRHSPKAKDLKDSLPYYNPKSAASIIQFARAVQAKYDDPSVDDGEIQLVLDTKFAQAGSREWDWLQQWLAEPANTRKSFLFAFQQKFLSEQNHHEVMNKLYDFRPDKSWDARKLVSEIIGVIRPLGHCIPDDQHRVQLENEMVTRFFQWAGAYLQDKVMAIAMPFDLDDVATILDVMKAHQPNVMLSLQPTLSVGGSQVVPINATLTDDRGFILTVDDIKRVMQASGNNSQQKDGGKTDPSKRGFSPNRGSFSRGSSQAKGSSTNQTQRGEQKASEQGQQSQGRSSDNRQGSKENYNKSGVKRDDKTKRLPFKNSKGRENYQPRTAAKMKQGPRPKCSWCFGERHDLEKCISYAKMVLKVSVPPKYSCYVCRAIGQHLGRFCPQNRPELKNMENEELCAMCPKKGHFSIDCPEPTRDKPDQAKLEELHKRFNSETITVNVFTGKLAAVMVDEDEDDESRQGDSDVDDEPVNLAHYSDDDEVDSDPGNE
jgi:hypothetical protein